MPVTVVLNGVNYEIPVIGDTPPTVNWGSGLTSYLTALATAYGNTVPGFLDYVSVVSSPITGVSGKTYGVNTASARTINLPAPAINAYIFVKDITGGAESNNITIARNGSEEIDGVAGDKTLEQSYGSWLIVSDGTDWFSIIDSTHIDMNLGSSGVAGSLDIFPSTASKGKLRITAAGSAGDTTTNIVNASQAGARTYTIPDAGASASFVMTAGTQSIGGSKTFSSVMFGANGAVGAPMYSFTTEATTGVYLVGAGNLGFAVAGAQRMTISSTINTNVPVSAAAGSAGAPAYTIQGDTDSGMYGFGENQLGFAVNGAVVFSMPTTGIRIIDGTVSDPAFHFASDTDTGLYLVGEGNLGFAVAGAQPLTISTSVNVNVNMNPAGNKALDQGAGGNAWDDIWADDFQNEGDIPFFDKALDLEGKEIDVDDLAIIRNIRAATDSQGKTLYSDNGFSYWDDTSLPEWIFTRGKNKITRKRSATSPVARSEEGRPYISLKVLCGLALGAIRQLETRVVELES